MASRMTQGLRVGDGRIALPYFELDVTCDGRKETQWSIPPLTGA
jgi:hypothetical protein